MSESEGRRKGGYVTYPIFSLTSALLTAYDAYSVMGG